jgi:D-alanyl-D-alanine carboxypeptidase
MQLRKAFFSTSSMAFGTVAAVLAVALMASSPADAARKRKSGGYNPPAAAIVVDVNTGRTLYSDDADEARYPASLTKMMTLYILFEELDRGRVRLNTPMRATANAAAQPPSKLGLRPGDTIEAEDAIKALVTKSANDVAVVIGEHIEGSESAFATRMTRTARALGMSNTTFRNASGLPDPQQKTTARDLAVLARALQDHHPDHFDYFATRSFTWKGRTMGNHNKLLGRVPGVNGIKTGFIRASGFNLTTNVERDGRHLVAVVMGGRSGASRDARMKDLIEEYLPRASRGGRSAPLVARAEAPVVARAEAPARVPVPVAPPREVLMASASAVATPAPSEPLPLSAPSVAAPAVVPIPVAAPVTVTAAAAGAARAASATATRSIARNPADIVASVHRSVTPAAITAQSGANTPSEALALATTTPSMRWVEGPKPATASPATAQPAAPSGVPHETASVPAPARRDVAEAVAEANVPESVRTGWLIQIGATDDAGKAKDLLERARARAGTALARAEPFTESVQKGEQTLYRARFGGFNERTAQAACKALKTRDIACFTIRN